MLWHVLVTFVDIHGEIACRYDIHTLSSLRGLGGGPGGLGGGPGGLGGGPGSPGGGPGGPGVDVGVDVLEKQGTR